MARKCARNAKENHFGSYGVLHKGNSANYVNQKYGMFDESFVKHQDGGDRFSMNYFYDVDQSCVDQLKEFLNRKTGKFEIIQLSVYCKFCRCQTLTIFYFYKSKTV